MAQPTPYARSFDFTQFSTDTPSAQQPGVRLDAEFDGLGETLGETLDNLALACAACNQAKGDTVTGAASVTEQKP